jgi:flavin reductase (DIM6/NTAB) family NADH-FMN oxidoreductase RutF
MHFLAGEHKEAGLEFSPLKAIVSPRPIGWISTRGRNGTINLAPYSYFNVVSEFPPMVIFSSSPRSKSTHKNSLQNVIETGEFAVNIVGSELCEAMNITSLALDYGESEFLAANLEVSECEHISAPRVSAAPASLECKLWKTVKLPTVGDKAATVIAIGTVTKHSYK